MKLLRIIPVPSLIVLFLTVGFCYGQSVNEQAKQSYIRGVGYSVQGQFKEAKEEFEKTLKVDPYL